MGHAFEINNDPLRTESPRPRHVAERFVARESMEVEVEANRENFIEARRAQLRERNVKVHSSATRARKQKEEQATSRLRIMEESMEAAMANRTKAVQKRTQRNERHLEHVKEVSKKLLQHEQTERGEKQRRISQKLSFSKWRRQQVQKMKRSVLGCNSTLEEQLREYAAVQIQKFTRKSMLKPFLREFYKLQLNRINKMSFQEAITLLQSSKVLQVTQNLLQRVLKLAIDPPELKSMTRVFLTHVAILGHKEAIVENDGVLEQELIQTAKDLHQKIKNFNIKEFLQSWFQFHLTFEAFKKQDVDKVRDNLIQHSLELVRLLNEVSGDSETTDMEWRPSILNELNKMKKRLLQIGGPKAMEMLNLELSKEMLIENKDSVVSNKKLKQSTPKPREMDPSKFEELRNVLNNMALAHEVVMDPNFSLESEKHIPREPLYLLESQNNFSFVYEFVQKITLDLCSLTKDELILNYIKEQFDAELIQNQIQRNCLDLNHFAQSLVEVMLKLCAPIRDEQIKSLIRSKSIADFLCDVSQTLHSMHLDIGNFYLQQLRPVLESRAVEYERQKFHEFLKFNSLTKTKEWLQPSNLKYEDTFNDALLKLCFSPVAISMDNVPETLQLDAKRLFLFQDKIQQLSVSVCLLLLIRNAFQIRDNNLLLKLANDVLTLVAKPNCSLEDICSCVSFVNEDQQTLASIVSKTASGQNPVFNIVQRRLHAALKHWLQNYQSPSLESLTSHGLNFISKQLEELGRKLVFLAKHNKAVYAPWYDEILSNKIN